MRELVVEPVLRLMFEHGITTSRKQRPRKRIFDTLFDWLGIKKLRPTSANIARDLQKASDSTPKAKRSAHKRELSPADGGAAGSRLTEEVATRYST